MITAADDSYDVRYARDGWPAQQMAAVLRQDLTQSELSASFISLFRQELKLRRLSSVSSVGRFYLPLIISGKRLRCRPGQLTLVVVGWQFTLSL